MWPVKKKQPPIRSLISEGRCGAMYWPLMVATASS
jgi:hypothetical protein